MDENKSIESKNFGNEAEIKKNKNDDQLITNDKLSKRFLISLIFLNIAGQIAWAVENQYYNVYLYNKIAPKPLYISIIVAVTAVVATITSISMGAWSDRLGKRRPFLIIGYTFWAIFTAIFPLASVFHPVILAVAIATLFDSIMTFFGSMSYDACFQAYVTENTTLNNRGKAISIVEITTIIAILIVYGGAGIVIEIFDYDFFFYLTGVLVGIIGIIGALLSKDNDRGKTEPGVWERIKESFTKEAIRENKDLFLLLIAVSLWSMAFNIFFPYVLVYLEHNLKLTGLMPSIVFALSFLISIIAAVPIGKYIDRKGRKKVAVVAVILEAIGLCLFSFATEAVSATIFGAIFVFAMMLFDIASGTWLKDLYPENKQGQFSGYFILFTVMIAMTFGPIIGGWYSETYGIPYVSPDGIPGFIPPSGIFMLAGIFFIPVLIPLLKVHDKKENKVVDSNN